jgi:hypothetical protein
MQGFDHGIGRGALRGLTIAALGWGLAVPGPSGPAQAASRSYVTTSFDSIRVIAPVRVAIVTGGGVSSRGEGDSRMLDRIDMSVSGRTLTVRMRPSSPGEKGGPPPTLFLSTDELRRVTLAGGGSVQVDRMKGLRGEIVLTGSGDVAVTSIALDQLDVVVAGGGRVTLAGNVGTMSAIVSGPGALAAEALNAKQLKLTNDGPGSASAAAATAADVIAKGSGNVTVTGKAACTVERNGTGLISCGGEDY